MARQGDNYYLVLTDTVNEDSGVVMANAANNSGEARSYSRLAVSSNEGGNGQPPEFKKLFYDKHVQQGESLRLDAVILGSPKPKVKWLFNETVPELENVRCTMAGDTYSFLIDQFSEANCGRYSIAAENQFGKATCSAEILFQGSLFSPEQQASSTSQAIYHEETISSKTTGDVGETTKTMKQVSNINGRTSGVSTESKSIETNHPQMRDFASQSSAAAMRETGIQINTDVLDKSSQMDELLSKAVTRDESCQWTMPSAENSGSIVTNEAAPFVSSEQHHFASSSTGETKQSFSYSQHHQASSFSSTTTQPQIDFSTTLIKDINQHQHMLNYEPIELIFNRHHDAFNHHHHHCMHHELEEFATASNACHHCHHHQHRPMTTSRFEPISLIIQKPPPCAHYRSGSLPPLISKINFNSSIAGFRSELCAEHDSTFTDDESSCHYCYYDNPSSSAAAANNSNCMYYKSCSRTSRPTTAFKPVELILDASSLSEYSGKQYRYRDSSLPSYTRRSGGGVRMPIKHKNLITSSFIYDNNNNNVNNNATSYFYDYDYENTGGSATNSQRLYGFNSSDFLSGGEQQQQQQQQAGNYKFSTVSSSIEETRVRSSAEAKYPTMEMTIDLKTPPTIEQPLKYISVYEGQSSRLECILTGKYFLNF